MTGLIERVQDKMDEMARISNRLDGHNSRIGNLEYWRYSVDNDLNHLKTQNRGITRALDKNEH